MKLKELMDFIDDTDWQSNDKEVVVVFAEHCTAVGDPTVPYAVKGCQINAAGELEITVA
jgi:hypothetical protein